VAQGTKGLSHSHFSSMVARATIIQWWLELNPFFSSFHKLLGGGLEPHYYF